MQISHEEKAKLDRKVFTLLVDIMDDLIKTYPGEEEVCFKNMRRQISQLRDGVRDHNISDRFIPLSTVIPVRND